MIVFGLNATDCDNQKVSLSVFFSIKKKNQSFFARKKKRKQENGKSDTNQHQQFVKKDKLTNNTDRKEKIYEMVER